MKSKVQVFDPNSYIKDLQKKNKNKKILKIGKKTKH
jgi:hypothetical protein